LAWASPAARGAALALFVVLLAAYLVWTAPMRQMVRLLPAVSNDAVQGVEAEGRWHDGALRLVCRLPAGRWLDCGHYSLSIAGAVVGLRAEATQPSGGRVTGSVGVSGWQAELAGFRMPMSSLALLFPLAGQMQLGGIAWIDGRIEPPDRVALDIRWQSAIGEFPTGEQRLRVDGGGGRVGLRFVPTPGDAARPLRAEGGVQCELPAAGSAPGAAARCQGAIELELTQADPRLEELIAATSRRTGPGRYRMQVDAR
jgi:hypothetical protein